jgi:hypothetical protein
MLRSGMRDADCVYLDIDDTWEALRDAQATSSRMTAFPI